MFFAKNNKMRNIFLLKYKFASIYHKLGHNIGLDHNNTVMAAGSLPSPRATISLVQSSGPSWPFEDPRNRLGINHYSNPKVKFQNVPTGTDEADAARRMTEVRFVIAIQVDAGHVIRF